MKSLKSAIDTVHTMTMTNGTIVTTTWHDTRAEADKRAAAPESATFRRVIDERPRGSILGHFRAVTWTRCN